MAILVMIARKMMNNKWLELSLLLGLVLTVALVSSMPIYTEAILRRMLVKDLENYQKSSGVYPATHRTSVFLMKSGEENSADASSTDAFMESVKTDFSLPVRLAVIARATDTFTFAPVDSTRIDPSVTRRAEIAAISDLTDHVTLVDGKLPAKEPVDGVYEAVVVENALTKLNMVLGNEFVIADERAKEPLVIRPVGVINPKDERDLYWFNPLESYGNTFFIDYDLFERDITSAKKGVVRSSTWYFAFDYSKMDLRAMADFVRTHERIDQFISARFDSKSIRAPALNIFPAYAEREQKLRLMLWSLNVPVMIMLGFYLLMVSNLIVERQKTEIAVLRSRGASRLQVLLSYVIEGTLLGGISFLVGPPVGMLFTKLLGSSNGFLEFVQRAALHAELNGTAYKYSLFAVLFSLVMTLIPTWSATRASIVGHKQQMARMHKTPFWHKYGIDVVLLGVSFYGLQSFRRRMDDLTAFGLDSADFKVDPLLFFVPALFTLGAGMVALRIYPWFVRFVYWVGRNIWPPALYSTLIQVGRSGSQYQFLMLFLIMTLAIGLFSASAARTMNNNTMEKVKYKNGADVVLNIEWENDAPLPGASEADEGAQPAFATKQVRYSEPPFQPFTELPGVAHAAKVFIKEEAMVTTGKANARVTLMGIDTDDFGRTAYLKDGLLAHHFYDYLNLISTEPSAVLISRTLAQQRSVKVGDTIYIGWSDVGSKPFIVYGIVDYWPTFNPNPQPSSGKSKPEAPMLVVGHLDYIQYSLALEPYQVWIDLEDDPAARQAFNEALQNGNFRLLSFKDTTYEVIEAKNDPFQLAINGVMTLGFIISVVISFFGFLLYWVLSLNSRVLQFGVLRAMGISFPQLIGMLVAEQLLTSGAGVALGAAIGNLTGLLFVPLFQLSFDPTTQVPPFEVVFQWSDSARLYAVVAFMIAVGLAVLAYLLSRIKIHQAVKLGED